jgi:subtilisin family serine protease
VAKKENPALVVDHGSQELKQVRPGGSPRKSFEDITPALRRRKAGAWKTAADESLSAANKFGLSSGVLKVKLRSKAIAKSHRPQYLLQQAGRARIIGATHIGTLLVAVTAQSAAATHDAFLKNTTQDGEADLTTIESINPYSASDKAVDDVGPAAYENGVVLTLFDFRDETQNADALASVRELAEDQHLQLIERPKRRLLVKNVTLGQIEEFANHPAVRKIWPNAALAAPAATSEGTEATVIEPPVDGNSYPVVGLLDDGVSPEAIGLAQWVEVGPTYPPMPPDNSDYSHGTFIAGLIAGGSLLNPGVTPLPPGPCRILAARVFSGYEPLGIEDLITRVDETVRAYPKIKVWNLSLGVDIPCKGPEFSPFACEIDEIALRNRVLFIIAAGNYRTPLPLRGWPADTWHADNRDLIGPPADSVLGLSVGSIAHAHNEQSAVKSTEPTAYSRRGPAPGLLPKPELVHYGGNCTSNNAADGCGIASVDPIGNRTLSWGTSFAAPLVASVAAHGWEDLLGAGHDVTPEMVRALVIHAAALGSPARKPEDLRYFGFGVPDSLDEVLTCDSSTFTTWHRVFIPEGQFVEHEFPMPACLLENGKFSGEIVITLCYAPPLDPESGAEYCRSNVNVKMGVVKLRKTKRKDSRTGKDKVVEQDGFRGEVPPDPRSQGEGYEEALIEHGFKWSPIKVYRRRFPVGIEGVRWQLRFDVLYRAGEKQPDQPQEAFAIVTVRGLAQNQPVYRDGVRAIQQKGHVAHSALSVRSRLRT